MLVVLLLLWVPPPDSDREIVLGRAREGEILIVVGGYSLLDLRVLDAREVLVVLDADVDEADVVSRALVALARLLLLRLAFAVEGLVEQAVFLH